MQRVASLCISTSAIFLIVVAVMLNSAALFYMATAIIALLAACRWQARLSVRALRFERVAPESVSVGEMVTVEIAVWSERQVKRPLIRIKDNFPSRMPVSHLSPSLPIAPAYEMPIRTQYQFRPLKRGKYRWSGLTAIGTDALGLITAGRVYDTTPAEITVLPAAIPINVELPSSLGWGISEAESGQSRGAGIEPRGIREYAWGDSLRHVHWRSTARTGTLLVKEFEAGSHTAAAFFLQDTKGTELGSGVLTSLDLMCSHALFLTEQFERSGASVVFPGLEDVRRVHHGPERQDTVAHLLAGLEAKHDEGLAEKMLAGLEELPPGSAVFLLLSVADEALLGAIARASSLSYTVVAMLYGSKEWKLDKGMRPADDPFYVEEIRAAGAMPVVVNSGGQS